MSHINFANGQPPRPESQRDKAANDRRASGASSDYRARPRHDRALLTFKALDLEGITGAWLHMSVFGTVSDEKEEEMIVSGRLVAVCALLLSFLVFAGSCEEEDTQYEFHVTNNGTGDFYIDCWDEITITGNYVAPNAAGTIILSGKARDGEYVRLCVQDDHCTQFAIVSYADYDVTITPDNTIQMSDR